MPGYTPSLSNDIQPVLDKVTALDANKPARFSYTQTAYDEDDAVSPSSFSLSNENNIPPPDQTSYTSNVLDQGNRAQSASIPRMAINHFFGRFSYNLAKLTQQFLAFIGITKKAFAHNNAEYDALQAYLNGDVCYVTRTIHGRIVKEEYKRTGTSPLSITGISPLAVGQSDWEVTNPAIMPLRAVGLLIPMYIYPADIYTNATYNALIDLAKQYHEVPMHVILNPDSGPGSGGIDGNYTVAIKRLQGAGIKVYGYVYCSYATIALSTVRAVIAAWQTRYPGIDGIFLDEMPSDAGSVAYVKALKEAAAVCAFPVMIGNAGAVSPYHYLYMDACAVDVIVVHESNVVPTEADLKGDMENGYMSYDYHSRGALMYAQPSFNSALFNMVSKYVGMLYITDAAAGWAVWNTISAYMTSMLSTLAARNGSILATGYTIVQRDSAGRSQITTPTSPPDIANKGYVDSGDATVKAFFTGAGLNASSPSSSDANAASVGTIISINGTHEACVAGNCPNIGLAPTTLMWWNIFTFGTPDRVTQIASQAFNGQGDTVKLYVRREHDFTWSSWEVLPNKGYVDSGDATVKAYIDAETTRAIGCESTETSARISGDATVSYDMTNAIAKISGSIQAGATGSSYNLVGNSTPELLVNSTANPFTIILPSSLLCVGYKVKIINTDNHSSGLVKIIPFSGERIGGLAPDTAIYLQNVDQSGYPYYFQNIELVASVSTYWAVTGGQYMPEPGSADAPGSQYYLGKLRHLPLRNALDRLVYNSAPPPRDTWSSAIQVSGLNGVPVGAKAIRAKVLITWQANYTELGNMEIGFSDNNSNIIFMGTSHPEIFNQGYGLAGNSNGSSAEIDIPLSPSGQLYIYTVQLSNSIYTNDSLMVSVVGYYMGD
jgi:hypothetical protein